MTNFAAYMNHLYALNTFKSRIGLSFLIVLALSSCQKETRPKDVLAPEELSKLMVDLYLAEARMSGQNIIVKDSALKIFNPFEEKLKLKHGIGDSVLRKSYQYYIGHPEQLEKIYDSVIDTLNLREQKERTKTSPK
jgi:hypothetical protein